MTELVSDKVVLTADQELAMQKLRDWWLLPTNHPNYLNCVLAAPAGCGKTFLVKYFTKTLQRVFPLFTATTNEAARQLELAGVSEVRTTHSALGLMPSMGQEHTKFFQGQLPEWIDECNLLVIDEASMAGKAATEEDDDLIMNYVERLRMRTLWLGDWYQLPPVESENGISPVFEQDFFTVNLTEVVRNKGAILEFCTLLRKAIDQPVKRMPRVPQGVSSITTPNFYRMMKDEIFLDKARRGVVRIIGWRNATTDAINNKLREGIFGKELALAEAYLPSDQILFTKPLVVGEFPEKATELIGSKKLRQGASVNSRAEILKVEQATLYTIPCYKCLVRIEGGIEETAWIPTKAGNARLVKMKDANVKHIATLSPSKKRLAWEQWHSLRNVFASVKHSYAITTHRSQGATIEEVVVDTVDILSGANRSPLLAYKMLYTAASRAKSSLTLIRKM